MKLSLLVIVMAITAITVPCDAAEVTMEDLQKEMHNSEQDEEIGKLNEAIEECCHNHTTKLSNPMKTNHYINNHRRI